MCESGIPADCKSVAYGQSRFDSCRWHPWSCAHLRADAASGLPTRLVWTRGSSLQERAGYKVRGAVSSRASVPADTPPHERRVPTGSPSAAGDCCSVAA